MYIYIYINRAPESHKILRFVSEKMPKQYCDAIQLVCDCTLTMRPLTLCGDTALFGFFLETNIKISPDLGSLHAG